MNRLRQQAESRQRLRDEYRQEKERRLDLEASLQVARDIQQNLIPSGPPNLDGFDICGVYLPAEMTGGDFFDYVALDDGGLALVVIDVAGHGIGPALLAAETRACIRALARTTSDVGHIATIVNRLLAQDMPSGCFVTLFMAKLDPVARTLTYAAAGHCAHIVRKTGDSIALESQMPPLGVDDDAEIPSTGPLALQSGDILFLATDGLFETRSPQNTMLGNPRCLQLIYHHRREAAEKIVDELLHAMQSFAENTPPHDDVTIVVAKLK
jgi:serine phosphatase RsbU (regulator of sigma subunit)